MPSVFDEAVEKEFESIASEVANASDFMSAAKALAARLATMVDARKLGIFYADSVKGELNGLTSRGFHLKDVASSYSLNTLSDPVILSTLTLTPLRTSLTPDSLPPGRVPSTASASNVERQLNFANLIAIPIPQPRSSKINSLSLGTEAWREWEELQTTYETVSLGGRNYLKEAFSPFGVIVIESDLDGYGNYTISDNQILSITWFMRFVGPILWRHCDSETTSADSINLRIKAKQTGLLRSLINSLPDPMVLATDDYDLVLQNRRAKELLGMRENVDPGVSRAIEVNNVLLYSLLEKLRAGNSGNSSQSSELNLRDPDTGAELLFKLWQQPLMNDEGNNTVNILRDVTDLKRASNELERQVHKVKLAEFDAKRERDRLTLILENVADPIVVTDDFSNVILMNRQADSIFQYKENIDSGVLMGSGNADNSLNQHKEIIDRNKEKFREFIAEFVMSSDVSRRRQMVLSLLSDNEFKDLPVEIISGKILDAGGEAIAIVSVLHDLTNQAENERLYHQLKKFSSELEERVVEATAHLAERNERLQWQSNELERANRLKSEFLASMSHELRTPINALIGYTSIMLDRIYGDLTDKQTEGLERMQAAAQHLLALINDILDLARIEAGRMPLNLSKVMLSTIISEINSQVEPMFNAKGLRYSSTIPDKAVELYTDKTKVKQIILNLVSNAIKFTPSGSVTLKASAGADTISIEVIDTGIGIREKDIGKVWDNFRQVDQSMTREFGGTGLGLSIIKRLTQSLGGSVYLKSQYGRGSTFIVNLPIITSSTPEQPPVIDTFG